MMTSVPTAPDLAVVRRHVGAVGAARVSPNGEVIRAELPPGVHAETFAIMAATMVGASATAALELHRAPPRCVVSQSADATIVVLRTGPTELLALVFDTRIDLAAVLEAVEHPAGADGAA